MISQEKDVRYLRAWLTIMRTVISEYPWKNPLKNEKIIIH